MYRDIDSTRETDQERSDHRADIEYEGRRHHPATDGFMVQLEQRRSNQADFPGLFVGCPSCLDGPCRECLGTRKVTGFRAGQIRAERSAA